MTDQQNKQPTKAVKKSTASVALEGRIGEQFEAIRKYMENALPGVNHDNAAVLRFAIHTAASEIAKV